LSERRDAIRANGVTTVHSAPQRRLGRSNHDQAGQSFRERERAPVALSPDPARPWPLAHGIPMGAGCPYAKQSIDLAALA
jgi:hypothetical protein